MNSQKKWFISSVMSAAIAVSVVYSQDSDQHNVLETIQNESLGRGLPHVADTLKKEAELSKKRVELYGIHNPGSLPNDSVNKNKLYDVLDDGTPLYLTTNNIRAAQTTQTDELHAHGSLITNLSGANEEIGIWDEGVVLQDHEAFTARAVLGDNGSVGDHATHVAGTLIANIHANNGNSKGMAPNASLISYDWSEDMYEAASAVEERNLLISNHSYGTDMMLAGEYHWGKYGRYSEKIDRVLYSSPFYLQVWSAGNDRDNVNQSHPSRGGYDILSFQAVAKNNLVVGAVDAVSSHGEPSDINMTYFSSWGPTDDGRIKPDICGMGMDLLSSSSGSRSSYNIKRGTSMASPNVAGSLLLLQEYSRREYKSYLKSSTIKGLAIHSADEAGTGDGPDYSFGWGLLNMKRATSVLKSMGDSTVIEERTLDNDEVYSFKVMKHNTEEPLKVSICWTDPAGTENTNAVDDSTPALINDLDLRVTDETTEYFPWKLNPETPSAAAVKGDNSVDNIEVVEVKNGFGGQVYTIKVSHKGSISSGQQDYTVIVTGGQRVGGFCNLPQWKSTNTYIKGNRVEHNGNSYTAKQWTHGKMPQINSSWGPWEYNHECYPNTDIPVVTMNSSVSGNETYGLEPITFQADISSDQGLKQVLLRVSSRDGFESITPEKGALYTVSYTPKTYGKHNFEFIAIDRLGRKATDKIDITIYENSTEPSISFISHTAVDTVFKGVSNRIEINAVATIGRDRDVYISSPDYPLVERVRLSDIRAPFFTYDLDIPSTETASSMKLTAEIVEKNGSIAASQTVNLEIKTTVKPKLNLISFSDTLFTSLDSVTLRASATDADGTVKKVMLRLSNGTEKEMNKIGDEYQISFAPRQMEKESHIQIYAQDSHGALSNEKDITIRTSSERPNSAPTVMLRSLYPGTVIYAEAGEFLPIRFRFTSYTDMKNDGCEYIVKSEVILNGVKQKEISYDAAYGETVETLILPTKFGRNTLTIRTVDERGVWGETDTYFTIAHMPEVTFLSPVPGSTVERSSGDSLDIKIKTNSDVAPISSIIYDVLELVTGKPPVRRSFHGDPEKGYGISYLPTDGNGQTRIVVQSFSGDTYKLEELLFDTMMK